MTLLSDLLKPVLETFIGKMEHVDFSKWPTASPMQWTPLDWRPGGDIQMQCRLNRAAPTIHFKDFLLDKSTMDSYVEQYVSKKDEWGAHWRDGQAMNFVEAFVKAVERTPNYCLGEIVPPNCRSQEWAEDWIFGPRCETTTFAKVEAIKTALRCAAFMGQMRRFLQGDTRTVEITVGRVDFIVTPLVNTSYGYLTPRDLDRAEYHVRFATYEDYDAWAEMASRDRTALEVSGEIW